MVLGSVDKMRVVPKREIISITSDRQFTIPEKYFTTLGFRNEAECFFQDGGFFIRPLQNTISGEFAEQIFADLISQGYEGQELLKKFKEKSLAVRPAVKMLIEEADAFAKTGEGYVPMEELFGEVV